MTLGKKIPLAIPEEESGKAIRGHEGFARVYLWEITTERKRYKCWLCGQPVLKGTPHTFFRFLFKQKKTNRDHHHIHNECANERVLPNMTGVETIPYAKVPLKRRWRPRS